jgi:uncharacterized protein (DUF1697 family)
MSWVALLRGINVGGNNLVPMKALAVLFEQAGARDVRTYIQSGNVVFAGAPALVKKLPALMQKRMGEKFGCQPPVILRSHDELLAITKTNPFAKEDLARVMVMFLDGTPTNIGKLDVKRSPPDRFAVRGREIFLHYPNGSGRSKLTNDYFDRTLGTIGTVRNWNTVLKLLELTA